VSVFQLQKRRTFAMGAVLHRYASDWRSTSQTSHECLRSGYWQHDCNDCNWHFTTVFILQKHENAKFLETREVMLQFWYHFTPIAVSYLSHNQNWQMH